MEAWLFPIVDDAIRVILQFLEPRELGRLAQVNRRARRLIYRKKGYSEARTIYCRAATLEYCDRQNSGLGLWLRYARKLHITDISGPRWMQIFLQACFDDHLSLVQCLARHPRVTPDRLVEALQRISVHSMTPSSLVIDWLTHQIISLPSFAWNKSYQLIVQEIHRRQTEPPPVPHSQKIRKEGRKKMAYPPPHQLPHNRRR